MINGLSPQACVSHFLLVVTTVTLHAPLRTNTSELLYVLRFHNAPCLWILARAMVVKVLFRVRIVNYPNQYRPSVHYG